MPMPLRIAPNAGPKGHAPESRADDTHGCQKHQPPVYLGTMEKPQARGKEHHSHTGYSGGLAESVEFLITPGRVTLLNESGLIRRIYTDGRSMPADLSDSSTGTSVGHWEGQTLVKSEHYRFA
jgi:hypothetical protein